MPSDSSQRSLAVIPGKYWELAALAVILLAALLFRTVNLSTLPAGFHGDEAVIGLEAQRILDEGHIGVYSKRAAGQPTGPIYLVAGSVRLFGETAFAVRIVPALLGTVTVLALYIVMRRNFGVGPALIGACILAVMSWHIHFARIGYPVAAWPLLAVLIAGAVAEAVRRGDWRWWAAAGALTGSGIYIYNAHPLLAAAVSLVVGGYLLFLCRSSFSRAAAGAAAFGLAMLVVLIPMIRFATAEDSYYWDHFGKARITETQEWQDLDGWQEQVRYLASSYRGVWDGLCCEPKLDVVDGTGLTVIAPELMIGLAGVGVLLALTHPRGPLVYLGFLIILIMPLGPTFTEGGEARRTLVMAPFLAMFCGLACTQLVVQMRHWGRRVGYAATVVIVLVLAAVVYQNLDLYFDDFAEPEVQDAILGKPIADAARFLDGRAEDHYVYFYSGTWSINYVTMQYLAPEVEGEDRSERFGDYHFGIEPSDNRRPLFVFVRPYLDKADHVSRIYPGIEITPERSGQEPTFRIFMPVGYAARGEPSRMQ